MKLSQKHYLLFRAECEKWLVEDVISDSWETIYDFKKLVKLSEQIARKVG